MLQPVPAGPLGPPAHDSSDALSHLLIDIHQSRALADVADRYLDAVTRVVAANGYAFYTFDGETGRPHRVGELGGVKRFVARYEHVGFTYDPLLAYIHETLQPVHESCLFSDDDWQRHPLRRALTARRLMRMLEAPVVLHDRRIGSLFFTRRPEAPPFTDHDLTTTALIARHVSVATQNALLLAEAEDRVRLTEATLDVVQAGLVVTDQRGSVRFANRAAEHLLSDPDRPADAIEVRLRQNLHELDGPHKRVAVSTTDVSDAGRRVVLRSQRLPDSDAVATFLHEQVAEQEGSRFSHLLGVLSPREVEVLELIAQGLGNKEIARRLFVSPSTVQYYLRRMFTVMEVHTRSELLAKAHAS